MEGRPDDLFKSLKEPKWPKYLEIEAFEESRMILFFIRRLVHSQDQCSKRQREDETME